MLIHTEDAYEKLIEGQPTIAKAWKKSEDNFEKKSNARMILLRRELIGLRLIKEKAIAKYLGEFRELKPDVQAAGQTVSEGLQNAECPKCSDRGHTNVVCRHLQRGASGRAKDRGFVEDVNGAAFVVWGDDVDVRKGVWIVDSGSTQHVTDNPSQFTSSNQLVRDEKIVGICGKSSVAIGIGDWS
ncbi:hypothetical protein KFL_014600010 [Klebsormidium nitens]|uniref:Uncharacterized protein n=1 Tax=Klebsormidium nitens TaxID=105231 RepID=A0A1Y1IR12_KLENI|nr:hypothetical protein KFL_014600010 [Klebsormidium nitens]|eukprot:GAQ93345.1 hypothetical protein KFL_014600010 [Klebsormidium nitens]